ncbi:MAG: biotin--[acetyl-CoA-carboxylase] ligase [Planctomycetota bacterium]
MRREHFSEIDSTSSHARRRIEVDRVTREPFVVSADVQTAGRGRLGRVWRSPKGGVWLTIGWPTRVRPDAVGGVALLSALAARGAIVDGVKPELEDDRLRIKWPNDVLLDGAKVAGVLIERLETPSGAWLLVGVGLNADVDAATLEDLGRTVATLRTAMERAVEIGPLGSALIDSLTRALQEHEREGLSASRVALLERVLAWRDRPVELIAGTGEVAAAGRLDGITPTGGVRIDTREGLFVGVSGELRRVER